MKLNTIAGCLLLLFSIIFATISNVQGACAACNDPSGQQDVLNAEINEFLGKTSTASTEIVSSTGGLVNPRYSRQNSPSLNAKNNEAPIENLNTKTTTDQSNSQTSQASSGQTELQRSETFVSVLVPIESVSSSSIILDISPNSTEYIPSAINIPYTEFLKPGGVLKPVSELVRVLGDAGVSHDDPLLIYGECQPCGGGPSAATFVYAIMKYLGHKNVKLLDGGIDDWVKALRPTVTKPAVLAKKNYTPIIDANLFASYEYVHSGTPQIIDARTTAEFAAESIGDAVNIPYDDVLDGKKIKDEATLERLFSSIRKDTPVVVYTNTGVKASMVWLALTLLGYDARLYTWQDWLANQPKLNIAIKDAKAQPNPANTGDVIQIMVVFEDIKQDLNSETEKENNSSNETVLTIKGCATCGFGSPQGYADLTDSDGTVRIGSTSQTQKNTAVNDFKVSAIIKDIDGSQIDKVVMKRVSGDQFAGIWNANTVAGIYRIDIVASLENITKTFNDAIEVEVVSTSKFKSLGN